MPYGTRRSRSYLNNRSVGAFNRSSRTLRAPIRMRRQPQRVVFRSVRRGFAQ